MNKICFNNDYSEIACPEIIENISKYSKGHYIGYGGDEICESAREKIKKRKTRRKGSAGTDLKRNDKMSGYLILLMSKSTLFFSR